MKGVAELDPLPSGQPFSFEAQRPAIAARGLAEAEGELRAFVRAGQRVFVTFPHRGEALRTEGMLRRAEARVVETDEELPAEAEVLFAVSPARRGFVWRDLGIVFPDTGFAAAPAAHGPLLGRALIVHRAAPGRLRRPRSPRRQLLGFETRGGQVTPDYLLLGFRGHTASTSRTSPSERCRGTST